ncbi:hypothetical protein D3C81_2169360 [compost metagenome]
MSTALLQRKSASWAFLWIDDFLSVTLFRDLTQNFRDYVIGAADEYTCANRELQILTLNVPDIVERTVLHRNSGQLDRLYFC